VFFFFECTVAVDSFISVLDRTAHTVFEWLVIATSGQNT